MLTYYYNNHIFNENHLVIVNILLFNYLRVHTIYLKIKQCQYKYVRSLDGINYYT